MQVTVQYSAQARTATGTASETIDLERATSIRSVLVQLADKHGDGLRKILLTGQGDVHQALLLFVGDEQVDAARELHAGDVLSILPPLAGG
ncbi:MAG: MoaD/ThiS family protein [Gemmataceae bacterium]